MHPRPLLKASARPLPRPFLVPAPSRPPLSFPRPLHQPPPFLLHPSPSFISRPFILRDAVRALQIALPRPTSPPLSPPPRGLLLRRPAALARATDSLRSQFSPFPSPLFTPPSPFLLPIPISLRLLFLPLPPNSICSTRVRHSQDGSQFCEIAESGPRFIRTTGWQQRG